MGSVVRNAREGTRREDVLDLELGSSFRMAYGLWPRPGLAPAGAKVLHGTTYYVGEARAPWWVGDVLAGLMVRAEKRE